MAAPEEQTQQRRHTELAVDEQKPDTCFWKRFSQRNE
jgi:hypothetical protein